MPDDPDPESGFHVIHGPRTCYLNDRPHNDPTGCPTCEAKDRHDWSRCTHYGEDGLYAQQQAAREAAGDGPAS